MGLKQIFEAEKEATAIKIAEAAAKMAADAAEKSNKDTLFFNSDVLPILHSIISEINKDPDIDASFKINGNNGGYFVPYGCIYQWAFLIQFRNKDTQAEIGSAPLHLAGYEPSYVYSPDINFKGIDLKRDPSGVEKVIERLIRIAAGKTASPLAKEERAPAPKRLNF